MTSSQNTPTTPIGGNMLKKIVNSDLLEERKNLDFHQGELTRFIYGDDYINYFSKVNDDRNNYPELQNHHSWYSLSPEEQQEVWFKKLTFAHKLNFKRYFSEFDPGAPPLYTQWTYAHMGLPPGHGLNYTMFMYSIEKLGSDEQHARWLQPTKHYNIVGCYAQTELGHGSNVAGIETTATWDEKTDEFVVHTPTVTATKFWPGDLGHYTSHAIVFARLRSKGKDYGVQPFMVQIRDLKTWEPCKGVELGDIGAKFGYNSKENGFMVLNNVRIPRTDMLNRFTNLDKEGNFEVIGDLRIIFCVMMLIRMHIVNNGPNYLAQACLVGTRYAVCRRQFKNMHGSKQERKIMDYQTHMVKFSPLVAKSYLMLANVTYIKDLYTEMMTRVRNDDFSLMDVMHHLLSGYKVIFTNWTHFGIDIVRQNCGGAGYTANSGLPEIFYDSSPLPVFEGDNVVLTQQASKFLIKLYKKAIVKNKQVDAPFSYLNRAQDLIQKVCGAKEARDFFDLRLLKEVLEVKTTALILSCMKLIESSNAPEKSKLNELFTMEITAMTMSHFKLISLLVFEDHYAKNSFKSKQIMKHIKLLQRIYCLNEIIEDSQPLYECGYFTKGQFTLVKQAFQESVRELRPMMIPLVESFAFDDNYLMSSIGNSYGDTYETALRWAREHRMNKNKVTPMFEKYIKPMIDAKHPYMDEQKPKL